MRIPCTALHHTAHTVLLRYHSSKLSRLPNSSIKVATLSHTPSQILSNISKAIPAIAAHIPGGWENIQSLLIKTNTSVSLPIWSCTLDERWIGSVKGDEGNDEKVEAPEKKKGKKKEQGKKRPVEEDESEESEEEQPTRKKAKSAKSSSVTPDIGKSATKQKKTQAQPQPASAPSTDQTSKKPPKPSSPTPSSKTQSKQKSTKKAQLDAEPSQTKTKTKDQPIPTPEGKGLNKSELKQKRTGTLLEKKKGKVVSSKVGLNGKSAKAKMLGKKALQA